MKNKYRIEDRKTYIYLRNIDKWAVIDTTDLTRANEFTGYWSGWHNKHTKSYYATGNIKLENGKRGIIWLHRWILNMFDPKIQIDHKNRDTLDDTRYNLGIVTNSENHQNMNWHRANKAGVTWHKHNQNWMAQITVGGKHIYLGSFPTTKEASDAYKKARNIYHPYGISCE